MILRGLAGVWLVAAAVVAAAESFVVSSELWDRPRSGRAVLELPAIRQAVNGCLAQPGARLVVHHGNSQESQLAAEELRAWLVALAVEPARISLRSGLAPAEPLRLEVIQDRSRGGGEKR